MILLPISQWLYTPPAILFLISRRGEHNITLNIAGGVHHHCDIFSNIQGRREEYIPNVAGGVHPPRDIDPNIQKETK